MTKLENTSYYSMSQEIYRRASIACSQPCTFAWKSDYIHRQNIWQHMVYVVSNKRLSLWLAENCQYSGWYIFFRAHEHRIVSFPHSLQKSEILQWAWCIFQEWGDNEDKCLPNSHSFEHAVPHILVAVSTKQELNNETNVNQEQGKGCFLMWARACLGWDSEDKTDSLPFCLGQS